MKNKLIITFLLVTACLATTSCNTFYGIGKDLQSLGSSMTSNAQGGAAPVNQAPRNQAAGYGPADYPPPR